MNEPEVTLLTFKTLEDFLNEAANVKIKYSDDEITFYDSIEELRVVKRGGILLPDIFKKYYIVRAR